MDFIGVAPESIPEFMKVLMFGWEFPPHISGGLGTACFGLTRSLLRQKVKVLFVVPRLYGDESSREAFLIDASEVKRISRQKTSVLRKAAQRMWRRATGKTYSATIEGSSADMTVIGVPADISPYHHTPDQYSIREKRGLSSWNYSMPSAGETAGLSGDDIFTIEGESSAAAHDGFRFSGTYGPNLWEEVKRYGEVGGILAEQYSFDVIHAHDWMTFQAGMTARRISKKPLVIHVHSTEIDRAGDHVNQKVFALEKRGFMEADLIVTVSNWTRQIVVSRYGISEEKIRVVHNGILPREASRGLDFPDIGSHFVTFLGRVTHQKGPVYFVEAAQKVLQEFPDAHFIVAGAGDLLPQIIERVAALNMSANFHFTGFLSASEVDQVWSMTDVYVMPSVSEPFGIAPLEAIQGGVPVIMSNQSGVSEVMPHAIKVDFWDIQALAGAICSVLRYESLSEVLRRHGKQHIKHLTWDKAASDVKAIYHELKSRQ